MVKLNDLEFKAKIKNKNKLIDVTGIDLKWPPTGRILVDITKNKYDVRKSIESKDIEAIILYTGLKDQNNKKIFEYDIINIDGDLYIVKYWNGEFILIDLDPKPIINDSDVLDSNDPIENHIKICINNEFKSPHMVIRGFFPWILDDKMRFIVVGNKFENPELMKKIMKKNIYNKI